MVMRNAKFHLQFHEFSAGGLFLEKKKIMIYAQHFWASLQQGNNLYCTSTRSLKTLLYYYYNCCDGQNELGNIIAT